MRQLILSCGLAMSLVCSTWANEEASIQLETKRQARSVHAGYRGLPDSTLIYIEAEMNYSAPGSYFCLMGFNVGYAGIQELPDGRKVGIFSVWDPGSHDASARPDDVAKEYQVKVLYGGEGVDVSRFGGEGTGGKSMFNFDWKTGDRVRMAVQSAPDGKERTAYTGWIYDLPKQQWKRIASFSTLAAKGHVPLKGMYSFVEDFRRNYNSKGWVRKATFYTPSVYKDGKWFDATGASFTADRSRAMNIDGGPVAGGFFLQTGGTTKNESTPLWQTMKALPIGETMDIDIRQSLIKAIAEQK